MIALQHSGALLLLPLMLLLMLCLLSYAAPTSIQCFFFALSTHVGVDVVPVGDFVNLHALLLIAESIGMVPHVVHWI